jgi:hypothetical protein
MEAKYLDQNVIIEAIPGMRTAYVSNEFTDDLKARIRLNEETEQNYFFAIIHAQTYAKRAEYMRLRRYTVECRINHVKLLHFIEGCIELKTDDMHNNVNRFCTIPGDRKPRQWRVVFAMQRDEKRWAQYLVRNIRNSDEFRVVSLIQMMDLY